MTLKDHLQLGEKLGLFDFESGAKVSGQKFVYFRGGAALLEMVPGIEHIVLMHFTFR